MNAFGKVVSTISDFLEFNQATLSGALDVIVIEHPDGSLHCNSFRVRFGKLKLLKIKSQEVSIKVNGKQVDLKMKLKKSGEAYFFHKQGLEEEKSPEIEDTVRSKTEQILPKKGDFCDDLIPDEEIEESEAEVQMSLCAHLWDTEEDQNELFLKHLVDFKDFSRGPWVVLNDPKLLIRIGNKVYNKEEAIPMILSLIVYKKDFPVAEKKKERDLAVTLSSEQLKSLDLVEGKNDVVFTVNSQLQGEQNINSSIYLWKWDSKIIISDIDGTITKSDVLGHIYGIIGKDYTHQGIAEFYTQLTKNGYKILYLSSRAIGQAAFTREFLFNLRQNEHALPLGPLIISPDRLLKSLMREVVHKTPQVFKSSALSEILELFPSNSKAFFAGFGNRDTDAIAYRSVGVDLDKIFIINPEGQIFSFDNITYTSYSELLNLSSEIFPVN